MHTRFVLAVALAVAAAGCEKARTTEQRAAAASQSATFVGCVEQGATHDEFVLKGRSVLQRVVATTGSQPGGLPSTETLPGGDADRNWSRGGTREDWAERISPQLVSGQSGVDFRSELGSRVVVSGEFVPASMAQPLDQLRVEHLDRVSGTCDMQ